LAVTVHFVAVKVPAGVITDSSEVEQEISAPEPALFGSVSVVDTPIPAHSEGVADCGVPPTDLIVHFPPFSNLTYVFIPDACWAATEPWYK
jgi:hypothetical protein